MVGNRCFLTSENGTFFRRITVIVWWRRGRVECSLFATDCGGPLSWKASRELLRIWAGSCPVGRAGSKLRRRSRLPDTFLEDLVRESMGHSYLAVLRGGAHW